MRVSQWSLCFCLGLPAAVVARDEAFEPPGFSVMEALAHKGVDVANLPVANMSSNGSCSAQCSSLAIIFKNGTFMQGTPAYDAFRASYWSSQQAEVSPQCVFQPTSAQELSIAILLSRLSMCPFAAKSVGHAAFATASSIEDGFTISFAKLNQITVAADRETAAVGPGNKWQAVYEALEKQGLLAIGGRDGDIGVGGLTTGGGISLFSSERGWACDNVAAYEVVTASGLVIKASPTTYPDLYWALRGGGNNFGLVTAFHINTFEQGLIWGGAMGWTSQAFPDLIRAFYNYGIKSPSDNKAAAILSFTTALGGLAQTLLSYSAPSSKSPIIQEFISIPGAIFDTTSVRTASNYSSGFASWPAGARDEIWTHTSQWDIDHMTFVKDTLYDITSPLLNGVANLSVSVSFQCITQGMLDHMSINGGNTLGLVGLKGPLFLISQAWIWANAADDPTVRAAELEYRRRVQADAAARGIGVEYLYMNYGNAYQDVIASYGAVNKQRLVEVAAAYDPTGVFQTLQPGYFKLKGPPVVTDAGAEV